MVSQHVSSHITQPWGPGSAVSIKTECLLKARPAQDNLGSRGKRWAGIIVVFMCQGFFILDANAAQSVLAKLVREM